MTTIVYDAMMFAFEVHKFQYRKYINTPYTDHLSEVAGIVSSVDQSPETLAIAWLHDCVEDQDVTYYTLWSKFGGYVADGVLALSDLECGNRATRKAMSRRRLADCSTTIQNIKCADIISNTSSIIQHDPSFASVYLKEILLLLEVMTKADRRIWKLARSQCLYII
jgi:(p)ppGpp synthase/HD superfamily hydrolase